MVLPKRNFQNSLLKLANTPTTVADPAKARGGWGAPLILGKKRTKSQKEEQLSGQAEESSLSPLSSRSGFANGRLPTERYTL